MRLDDDDGVNLPAHLSIWHINLSSRTYHAPSPGCVSRYPNPDCKLTANSVLTNRNHSMIPDLIISEDVKVSIADKIMLPNQSCYFFSLTIQTSRCGREEVTDIFGMRTVETHPAIYSPSWFYPEARASRNVYRVNISSANLETHIFQAVRSGGFRSGV